MALPATAPPHCAQHRSGRAAAAAANLIAQNAAHQAAEHSAPARSVAALRYLHDVDARDTAVLGRIRLLLRVRGIRLVVLARWRSARRQRRGQNDACNQRKPAGDGRHEILLWCGSRRSRRRCTWWMGCALRSNVPMILLQSCIYRPVHPTNRAAARRFQRYHAARQPIACSKPGKLCHDAPTAR